MLFFRNEKKIFIKTQFWQKQKGLSLEENWILLCNKFILPQQSIIFKLFP